MKNWLCTFYLMPHSYVYRSMDYLVHYWQRLLFIMSVIILTYPIVYLIQQRNEYHQLQIIAENTDTQIIQQEKLLQAIIKKQEELKAKDSNIALMNEKIKQQLLKENIEIESIQWQIEGEKKVIITVNQQARILFQLIKNLMKLEQINFNDMQFIKLNRDKLVQLSLTLTLIE